MEVIFFYTYQLHDLLTVYLIISSLLFLVDNMQKLLYPPFLSLYALWRQLLTTSKASLLAGCTLLLLSGLANPAQATGFYKDFIVLNGRYLYTNSYVEGLAAFQNENIKNGTQEAFDRGNGVLTLGAEANTFSDNGDDVQPPQLFYRVYLEGRTPGPFTSLNLGFVQAGNDGNPNNKKWNNVTTLPNLISATTIPGKYVLEVYFQAAPNYNDPRLIYDSNRSANYKAYFNVNGSLPAQWDGSENDGDWFNPYNWSSDQVPTITTNVTIPYGGVSPHIRGGIAQVRTLIVNGDAGNPGVKSLFQDGGELQVFGDFINNNSSFSQNGGVFVLAGSVQTFDGGSFFNVRVQGGGEKTLRGRMDIVTNLDFVSGILITDTNSVTNFNIDLGPNATITNESETAYVQGILRSIGRTVSQNTVNAFGNIGVELTATTGNPGVVLVTRVTGPKDFSYKGVGDSRSIRRGFIFTPDNQGEYNFTLVFHYLDNELGSTPKENLLLFRSLNGLTPFEKLNKTSTTSNTLTREAIAGTLNATFTLGNSANPLPVTLVSFTAVPTAQGGALLRWNTATESNNKGFGIERQLASGDAWQPVGYLATGNNATGGTYEYTDKSLATAAFTPQAYYRLRQEDLDGKLSYSPVTVVSRSAVATSTSLLLSPVPVTGSNISLTFAEAGQAGSEISIINVQGQRLLHYTTQSSDAAALSLPVEQLAAGVYIVNVRVPGQALRHARFVKL